MMISGIIASFTNFNVFLLFVVLFKPVTVDRIQPTIKIPVLSQATIKNNHAHKLIVDNETLNCLNMD